MPTASTVMNLAAKYIGTKEYPKNSNNVIFNTDYYGRPVSGDYPWCCTYVWDIYRMAKASKLFYDGLKVAYCPYVYNWGKRNKLNVPKSQGRYGDIVLFDWTGNGEADHIGFIVKQYADGSYLTIEGNTAVGNDSNGGEVMYRTRYQYKICMIIRPKYSEEDDMTADEVRKIVKEEITNILAGYGTKPSNWAADKTVDGVKQPGILTQAVDAGITDGQRPRGYTTREESAAMSLKVLNKLGEEQEWTVRALVHDIMKEMGDDGK